MKLGVRHNFSLTDTLAGNLDDFDCAAAECRRYFIAAATPPARGILGKLRLYYRVAVWLRPGTASASVLMVGTSDPTGSKRATDGPASIATFCWCRLAAARSWHRLTTAPPAANPGLHTNHLPRHPGRSSCNVRCKMGENCLRRHKLTFRRTVDSALFLV